MVRMPKKRKVGFRVEIPNINDDPRLLVDRDDIIKLTKMAKAWEFTCSFCFKKFPSAQAMGGHQNAHRNERMEEKRLYIRDPIGYRKRAYIKALKEAAAHRAIAGGPNPNPNINMHAAKFHEFDALGNNKNYFCQPVIIQDSPKALNVNGDYYNYPKTLPVLVMNFLPPKELSLAESVGVRAHDDAKGKAADCMELDVGDGYEVNLEQKLDLTLRL